MTQNPATQLYHQPFEMTAQKSLFFDALSMQICESIMMNYRESL